MSFFDVVYDFKFVCQLLTVCISLVIIFYPLKKTCRSILMCVLSVAILFAAGTFLNWGIFSLSNVLRFLGGINFPISWLILIAGYLVFIRIPFVNKSVIGGTLFVTVYASINVCRYIMTGVSEANASFPVDIFVLLYPVIIAYSILLRKLSLKDFTDLPMISVIMMLTITVCLSAVLIGKEAYDVSNGMFGFDLFYFLELIGIFIISVCSYLMMYFYAKTRRNMTVLQVENKLLEADKERIGSFEAALEEYHTLRHDINNQMNVLHMMLEKKDYEGMENYFESMAGNYVHEGKYNYIDCGNALINSVVNMEILNAKRNNVVIKPNIHVPEELPFESSDLSRILVNLIDNAIEALLRRNEENKSVSCSILTHGEYLYIGIENEVTTSDPEAILEMNTEKEDHNNHGLGHKIVKRIAGKYNGHVNYSVKSGTFFAEVMLDMNSVTVKEVEQNER